MFSLRKLAITGATVALAVALPAAAASASVSHVSPVHASVHLVQHEDSDFSGQTWALDNFVQKDTIRDIHKVGSTYDYTVGYTAKGTFVTQTSDYVGATTIVSLVPGLTGNLTGDGTVSVTGATEVPNQNYLNHLPRAAGGTEASESDVLAPGGTIGTWLYDYHYVIKQHGHTVFTAEQSNNVNTP